MAKRAPHFNGYVAYRYGTGRPITLAGQTRTVERRLEVLPGKRREAITTAAVAILERWRSSKFEFEGACRHGVRAGFCLDGFSYGAADAWSEKIVCEALRRIGAARPSWTEGQPEWTQFGYAPVERIKCTRCAKPLPEDARPGQKFCSKLCNHADRMARHRKMKALLNDAEHAAMLAASAQVRRDAVDSRMMRVCQYCETAFRADQARRRYCSTECRDASKRRDARTCQHCGSTFQPSNASRRFCSVACSAAARKGPPKRAPIAAERACKVCGGTFTTTRPEQMYCSRPCAANAHRAALAARLPPQQCPTCQQEFKPDRRGAKFCSLPCSRVPRRPAFICEAAE